VARRLRSPTLETRSARLRLKVRRKPYFVSVAVGVSLGYRRNLGPGSWLVRCADGKGGAWTKVSPPLTILRMLAPVERLTSGRRRIERVNWRAAKPVIGR
jgi:hypothetical protein